MIEFPFNVYLLAFLGAFFTTLATLPWWRQWCVRVGHVDDPGHRKIHHTPVALAGGLAVMTGLVVPMLFGLAVVKLRWLSATTTAPIGYGWDQRSMKLGMILIGAVGMVWLGWLDDKHELRPAWKFTGQFCIAALVAAAGVRITLFVPSILFSYAVTILWILTVTNAYNFMDNMNGLCAGLGVIGSGCFALLAMAQGQYLVALLALLAAGALLGFLPYNFPAASAFLGDAGSHLVGYLLAVLAILPHFYTAQRSHKLAVLSPLLILAVPLVDLAWVVLLRWCLGQPFYVGDTNHLSHRLVRRGLGKSTAVLWIWLLAAALGALAFAI